MKAAALLIKPNIARHHAENQAASLLRITIVRRGIDVKPDVVHVGKVAAELLTIWWPSPLAPNPEPSITLNFLNSGRCSKTMSRFELKPPVATTTALPWISKDSPFLVAVTPQTRPSCVSSLPALVEVRIVTLGSACAVLISAVIKPRPLLSGRCQRSTRLPS